MVKDTMKRKKPSFNESYHGYRTFSDLLEDADNPGLVDIERNPERDVRGQALREARGPQAPPGRQGAHGLASPGRAQCVSDAGSRVVSRGASTRRGSRASRTRQPTGGRGGSPAVLSRSRAHLRREMLQVGGAGLLGLSLPGLLRAEAEAEAGHAGLSPRADACILIFLNGGPSHLDMWDMKPDAPAEIRGEFKPIATTVPGVQL